MWFDIIAATVAVWGLIMIMVLDMSGTIMSRIIFFGPMMLLPFITIFYVLQSFGALTF